MALGGISVAVLGGVLFSFSSETATPEFRKIEVIRTIDGVTSSYDTLVSSDSDFGAKEYLAELGFENDKNLCIVNLSSDLETFDCSALFGEPGCKINVAGCGSQMKIDASVDGFEALTSEVAEEIEKNLKCSPEEMKCSKVMVVEGGDQKGCSKDLDFEALGFDINVFDSLMKCCKFSSKCDTSFQNGNCKVICTSGFVCDSSSKNCGSWNGLKPGGTCNIDVKMNICTGEDRDDDKCTKFCMNTCFGDMKSQNCTLVIVTEDAQPNRSPVGSSAALDNSLKVFPNPASDRVQLQVDLKKQNDTRIHITDARGNVVKSFDLGKFSGSLTESIDVSDWSAGVYFVRLTHGEYSKVEKLTIQ